MESGKKDQLPSLLRLAREKAHSSRRILLDNIADLFLDPVGSLSDRDSALMAEILWRLIHELEMAVRRALATRILRLDTEPRGLGGVLLDETVEMSRPVLAREEVIRDETLIEAVKHRMQEFLIKEAGTAPSESATNDSRSDGPLGPGGGVIDRLLDNPDAVVVMRAREYAVTQARRLDRFHRPMLSHAELPLPPVRRLVWWVAAAVANHVVNGAETKGQLDPALLDDIIEEIAGSVFDELAPQIQEDTPAQKLVARLAETGELNHDFLMKGLGEGHVDLFFTALATLCYLDLPAAQRIVFDPTGEGLALACKAMGFDRRQFQTIYRWTRMPQKSGRGQSILKELLKLYDTVSAKTAQRSLTYWKRNTEYLSAVQKVRN